MFLLNKKFWPTFTLSFSLLANEKQEVLIRYHILCLLNIFDLVGLKGLGFYKRLCESFVHSSMFIAATVVSPVQVF